MKKQFYTLVALVASALASISALAQPIVPLDVVSKGSDQLVTQYLLGQITSGERSYYGASLAAQTNITITAQQLQDLGYVAGSFSTLTNATSKLEFKQKLIEIPDGGFEVGMSISYYDSNGDGVLYGNGWLDIHRDEATGKLYGGKFDLYMYPASEVRVLIDNVSDARWVGPNGGYQDLKVSNYSGAKRSITLNSAMWGSGFLITVIRDTNGQKVLTGYDLQNGTVSFGEDVVAKIGQIRSNRVRTLKDPNLFDAGDTTFYSHYGQIIGQFPLTEIVATQDVTLNIMFGVPIYGSNYYDWDQEPSMIMPSHIFVQVVKQYEGLPMPNSFEIPFNQSFNGWYIKLPRGIYNVRTEFNGVISQDYYNGSTVVSGGGPG